MRKTVLGYGLTSAALSIAMMLATLPLLDSIGFEKTDLIGYTTIVLSALLVFFGVRSYRDGAGGGRLGFGRGFAVGLLITLVSCACSVVAFQIVYFKLTPEFGDRFAACMVERARASGASPEKLEETAKQAQALKLLYDNPLTNAALTFVQPFPIGLVASALSAAILRRR
jgi:cell division protein FtsL